MKRKVLLCFVIVACILNIFMLAMIDANDVILRLTCVGFGLVGAIAFMDLREKP